MMRSNTAEIVDVATGQTRPDLLHTFSVMATTVEVHVCTPTTTMHDQIAEVEKVFHSVEAACTRFKTDSPLMRANASPDEWHVVPGECLEAVAAAAKAHQMTRGLFDPRVLTSLLHSGYDETLAFRDDDVVRRSSPAPVAYLRSPWLPEIDVERSAIRLGKLPVDLGGIGKSYAVMRATPALALSGTGFLINAGGDCYAQGSGPTGDGWLIGVEDPTGGESPLAVLRISDAGCATSSTRLRRWKVDGRDTHHLIDPRTGQAGDRGLTAVTVVAEDTVTAETWTKALFLSGASEIATFADLHDLAALWVDVEGQVGLSDAMLPYVDWRP